jgi:hypothetical protein
MSDARQSVFALLLLLVLMIAPYSASADPLAETVRVMAETPVVAGRVDIAVHSETDGHLMFTNRAGERFTASFANGELGRAIATLAPDVKNGSELALYMTFDALRMSAFLTEALKYKGITRQEPLIMAVLAGRAYPAPAQGMTVYEHRPPFSTIELTPGWHVGFLELKTLEQAIWILSRPLKRSDLRIIALRPGAPKVLSSSPRIDPGSRAADVDPIDPSAAVDVVKAALSQVLVFSGTQARRDDLSNAAHSNDVTLLHIETGSTAQPGGRNFLWLPVKTPLMTVHAEQVTLLDLLVLFAGKRTGRIDVYEVRDRLQMEVTFGARSNVSPILGRWLDKAYDVANDVSGTLQARGIRVSLPTAARLAELDRRVIKLLPSPVQYGYAALLLLGLIGLPTAWRWFARIWPQENATDYANAAGFHAARAVRATLFAVVFMPLAAIVAAPVQLLSLLKRRLA